MKILIDSTNRKFKRLPIDGEIAGSVIIKHLNQEETGREQLYRIRHNCCGAEERVLHRELVHRHSKGVTFCLECGRKATQVRRSGSHPQALKQRAMELRARGLSCKKIGEQLGISRWTVREWTKKTRNVPQYLHELFNNATEKAQGSEQV